MDSVTNNALTARRRPNAEQVVLINDEETCKHNTDHLSKIRARLHTASDELPYRPIPHKFCPLHNSTDKNGFSSRMHFIWRIQNRFNEIILWSTVAGQKYIIHTARRFTKPPLYRHDTTYLRPVLISSYPYSDSFKQPLQVRFSEHNFVPSVYSR
jgi:hypothetical protein